MKNLFSISMIMILFITFNSCSREATFDIPLNVAQNKSGKNKMENSNIAPCPYIDDADCDGVPNNTDNCRNISNPDQSDFDNDGIGNACDSDDGTGGTPPTSSTYYVNAKTYYTQRCGGGINEMTYKCGLAHGIMEVLAETKVMFKNAPKVYLPVLVRYKIDKNTGKTSSDPITEQECHADSTRCYVTYRSEENDWLMRKSFINYINDKIDYINSLIQDYPNLKEYYEGYKSGCVQAFWFDVESMPPFKL